MKNFRKIASLGLLGLSLMSFTFAEPALAQERGDFERGAHHRHGAGRWKELNLSDSQKEQVKSIMERNKERTHSEINAILTTEQKAKWAEMREKRESRMQSFRERRQNGEGRPRRRGSGRFGRGSSNASSD